MQASDKVKKGVILYFNNKPQIERTPKAFASHGR